jgi:hypothetical protein
MIWQEFTDPRRLKEDTKANRRYLSAQVRIN